MPSNIPVAPKSQYEIERDERIKRNEAFMLSIGIDPHGGGYVLAEQEDLHAIDETLVSTQMKQNKKKAPPKAPARPKVRVRAPPLVAPPGRDGRARAPDLRRVVGRRAPAPALARLRRPPRAQEPPRRALSEEQRAALDEFNMDDFEASASA